MPPRAAPKKRKEPPAAAAAAAAALPAPAVRQRSQRGAKPAEGALVEGGVDPEKGLLEQIEARAFWEKWDTPLLFCWLYDFNDAPISPLDATDRAKLLRILVETGADRPPAKKALEELVRIWRKIAKPGAGVPPPGLFVAEQPASAAAAAQSASLLQALPPAPSAGKPPAEKERAESPLSVADSDLELSDEEDISRPPAPTATPRRSPLKERLTQASPVDAEGYAPHHHPLPNPRFGPLLCLTCLTAAPGPAARWLCTKCGLRGDLDADSAPNKALLAGGLRSPGSSTGSVSGTIANSVPSLDPASTLSRLDRDFDKQAKYGQPHLLFTGPTAGQPVPTTTALDIVDRAVGASATQRPSDKLVELIRSGKLVNVGYAIPRLLSTAQAGEEANAVGSMLFTESGTIIQQGKNTPPPVPSSQAFCMALFSTILPSLIDRPAAMLEWMALARTALHIEGEPRSSWTRANAYVDQLLQRRIPQRKGISEPCDAVLRTLHSTESFAQHGGAGGPSRTERRPDSRRSEGTICYQWNHNGECSRGNACRYRHVCTYCGGQHQAKACKKGESSASVPEQHPPYRKSGGKGGGSHRSGGASSVTTAKAAPAAAASARQE